MAALKEPEQVAGFLRACDAFQGTHEVRAALLLAPLAEIMSLMASMLETKYCAR
ncbi:hypothetical protein FACS1894158_02170 [Betaproteobacteria bacterium]|nr:hypothetical protein FACS1894158_02170 [Betaproteobacteria bacterium]